MPRDTRNPSPRMIDLRDAVARLTARRGYAPSFREIAADMSVCLPRVQQLAHRARDFGLVEFADGIARTIRVATGPERAIRRRRAGCA